MHKTTPSQKFTCQANMTCANSHDFPNSELLSSKKSMHDHTPFHLTPLKYHHASYTLPETQQMIANLAVKNIADEFQRF